MNSQFNIGIGVGVTTRNRPHLLRHCLHKMSIHWPRGLNTALVVSDDSDIPEAIEQNEQAVRNFAGVMQLTNTVYLRGKQRFGIAKNKNRCIEMLYGMMTPHRVEHFFLFDDDCWPIANDWSKQFITASDRSKVQHLMYNYPHNHVLIVNENGYVMETNNCCGMLLYFTRQVVDTIGGFDPRFNIYGYEHANFSIRSKMAGFHNGLGNYVSIRGLENYIESVDISKTMGWPSDFLGGFKSSVDGEDVPTYIQENQEFLMPSEQETLYREFRS